MSVVYSTRDFYLLDHGSSLKTDMFQSSPGLFYQHKQYFTSKKLHNCQQFDLCSLFQKLGYPTDDAQNIEHGNHDLSSQDTNTGNYTNEQDEIFGKVDVRKRRKIENKFGSNIWLFSGSVKGNKDCKFAEDCTKFPSVLPYPVNLSSLIGDINRDLIFTVTNDTISKNNANLNDKPYNHLINKPDLTLKYSGLFNKYTTNSTSKTYVISSNGSDYLIPPHSSFLMSDVSHFESITHFPPHKYNFLVIDPPWMNKSVRRGKKYQMTENVFDKMDIPRLLADDAIVAVWVTNKPVHIEYVLNTLFPSWGLEFVYVCFWLKVTSSGLPIVPFGSPHKKPYELVILGRKVLISENNIEKYKFESGDIDLIIAFPFQILESVQSVLDDKDEYDKEKNEEETKVKKIVIASIPCVQHSRKPPLNFIRDMFFPDKNHTVHCLELFARSLLPGWTSWGNEVLLFQNKDFYESHDTSEI